MQVWDYAFSLLFPLIPLCILKGTSGLAIYQTPLVTVIEGGTAIMNCTLSEESLGPVRWYKGGNHQQQLLYSQSESEKPDPRVSKTVKEGPTRETDQSIIFKLIRLEDAGVYYCVKFKSDKVTVAANGSGTHLHVNSTSGLAIYQTPLVTVIEGGTAIMNCTLSEESLGPVRWYKGDNQQQQLLYSQSESEKPDPRVTKTVKEGPTSVTDHSITFRSIRLEDAGVYYCVKFKSDKVTVATNGSGTHLHVNSTPVLTIYQTPSVTVIQGGTAIINCTVSEVYLGPVRWYKVNNQQQQFLYSQFESEKSDKRVGRTVNEGPRRDTDHSITFSRIRLEDAGVYYCVKFKSDKITVAKNGSGTHLYVNSTSGLTIYQTPFITGIQGGTARMNCTLSEVSVGPVRWYKEGNQQPLVYSQSESEKPNQRVSRTVKEGPTRETDHSIKFSPLRLEDAGVYYCVKFKSDKVTVVTNGSGTHLHVNSAYSRMIYQAPSVTGKEGGTVKMNCTVPHESLGPVRWYKEANLEKVLYSQLLGDKSDARASRIVHEEQERKNDFSITFSNITLEDAGVYYCVKFKSDNVTLAATGSGTRLYVSSAYELTIYQTPTVTSVEGDTVIMQCTLSQEIVGPVHWYKGSNQHKILYSQSESDKPDPRVSRTIKEGRTRETDLSIIFTNIALEDVGTYYCVKFKSDNVTVAASGSGTRLYVSRGSDLMIYQTLFVAGVEGDTVIMHCTLSEETVGPVRWYKGSNLKKLLYSQLSDHNSDARVSQIVHDGPTRDTDHSIAFTDITLEDAGVYYCVKLKLNGVTEAATGSGTQLNITSSIPS